MRVLMAAAVVALGCGLALGQDVAKPVGPVRVSGGVMQSLKLKSVPPVYPVDAKRDHVTGSVVLKAIIGKDGAVKSLEAISGPQMLRAAAMESVQQWVYRPFLLNGQPTEVETTVTVNFMINP